MLHKRRCCLRVLHIHNKGKSRLDVQVSRSRKQRDGFLLDVDINIPGCIGVRRCHSKLARLTLLPVMPPLGWHRTGSAVASTRQTWEKFVRASSSPASPACVCVCVSFIMYGYISLAKQTSTGAPIWRVMYWQPTCGLVRFL